MPLAVAAAGYPTPIVLSTINRDNSAHSNTNGQTGGSGTWGTANRAIFVPVRLTDTRTYTKAWWLNGATAAGNVDVGIYTFNSGTGVLTRIVASTAEAQSGVSAMQVAGTFTTTTLTPGLYYLAMSCSLSTATVIRMSVSAANLVANGHLMGTTAHPLQSSLSALQNLSAIVPTFGFSESAAI